MTVPTALGRSPRHASSFASAATLASWASCQSSNSASTRSTSGVFHSTSTGSAPGNGIGMFAPATRSASGWMIGNIRTRLNERRNQRLSFVAFPQLQRRPKQRTHRSHALVAAAMGAEQIKLMPHLVHGAGP